MNVLRISHPVRRTDDWGSGDFAASRGGRYHLGRDYLYQPDEEVRSPMEATILRIGTCYSDDPSFKLVEMLAFNTEVGAKILWRYFYVRPIVSIGEIVTPAQIIGFAQDISSRYQDPDRQPRSSMQ